MTFGKRRDPREITSEGEKRSIRCSLLAPHGLKEPPVHLSKEEEEKKERERSQRGTIKKRIYNWKKKKEQELFCRPVENSKGKKEKSSDFSNSGSRRF